MCGICGQISFNGQAADVAPVIKMTERMKERGPDALGLFVHGGNALGHRRLKIIDLSERAHQPMVDNALGLSIVYNGAIYNSGIKPPLLVVDAKRFYRSCEK